MPRTAMPVASTTVTEGPALAATGGGAGATRGHHAMDIVTSCAIPQELLRSAGHVAADRGDVPCRVRPRGRDDPHARAGDGGFLYKEIRDRMDAGAHLAAEPHHLGAPAPIADTEPARMRKSVADDPVVEAAFQLMDAVDQNGEVAIDGVPMMGPSACKLSMDTWTPTRERRGASWKGRARGRGWSAEGAPERSGQGPRR